VLPNDQIHTDTGKLCLVNSNLVVCETDIHDVNLNFYVFKSEIGNLESIFVTLFYQMIIPIMLLMNFDCRE